MTNLNDVTAGRYELVVAQFDQITSKPGEPFSYIRYRAGDVVELDIEDARRLVAAGAVVEPGVRQKAAAAAARAAYEAALAALPDDVRAELLAGDVTNVGPTPDTTTVPDRPADGAKKAIWVDYAVALGIPKAEANKLNKDDLIARIDITPDVDGDGQGDPGSDGDVDPDGNADGDETQGAAGNGGSDSLPLDTAPEEQWAAAAIERGLDADEVAKMSKQELIDILT